MRSTVFVLVLMLMIPVAVYADSTTSSMPEPLSAASAILVEVGSGRVLYEHEADVRRSIASTTKIMTALVAAELCNPEEILKVQADCVKIEGSSLYLEENEEMTLLDLLYGLILRSGNDAAATIAKFVAGDIDHFVSLMNQKALALGMKNTCFANPHGLDNCNHYSTARDMALLGVTFLKQSLLSQICTAEDYISRELTSGRVRLFVNNNKLLRRDPRACGIKIGWTENAGRCLVAAAKAGGVELVAVVLAAPDLYGDVGRLFDYGFSCMQVEELLPQGRVMAILPVNNGQTSRVALATASPVCYPVLAGETLAVTAQVHVPTEITAPLKAGQQMGTALVTVDGGWAVEVQLVTLSAVEEKKNLSSRLSEWIRGWWWHD